jgi:hypothetical protein
MYIIFCPTDCVTLLFHVFCFLFLISIRKGMSETVLSTRSRKFTSCLFMVGGSLRYHFKIALKYFKNNLRRPFENCEFTRYPQNPQNIKNMWMRMYLLVIRTITNLYSTSKTNYFPPIRFDCLGKK